jgi:hypothetical protein
MRVLSLNFYFSPVPGTSANSPEATLIKKYVKKGEPWVCITASTQQFFGKVGRLHLPVRAPTPENQRKKACKTIIINYFLTELSQQSSRLNFFAVNEGADQENCEACTNYKQR